MNCVQVLTVVTRDESSWVGGRERGGTQESLVLRRSHSPSQVGWTCSFCVFRKFTAMHINPKGASISSSVSNFPCARHAALVKLTVRQRPVWADFVGSNRDRYNHSGFVPIIASVV